MTKPEEIATIPTRNHWDRLDRQLADVFEGEHRLTRRKGTQALRDYGLELVKRQESTHPRVNILQDHFSGLDNDNFSTRKAGSWRLRQSLPKPRLPAWEAVL